MREYRNTQFWEYIRNVIGRYAAWIEEVRAENEFLVNEGKEGINAMNVYADTNWQEIYTTIRSCVRFNQCTHDEFHEAMSLIRLTDKEYRYELMKIELDNTDREEARRKMWESVKHVINDYISILERAKSKGVNNNIFIKMYDQMLQGSSSVYLFGLNTRYNIKEDEYLYARWLLDEADTEFRHELMKIELEAAGEI